MRLVDDTLFSFPKASRFEVVLLGSWDVLELVLRCLILVAAVVVWFRLQPSDLLFWDVHSHVLTAGASVWLRNRHLLAYWYLGRQVARSGEGVGC